MDYCPRPERRPCHLVDEFRPTQPLVFHPNGVLSTRTPRRARRLRLNLDCLQGEPVRKGPRRWTVIILGSKCTQGILDLFYARRDKRPLRIRYTFNLENHGHCEGDGYASRGGNAFVRLYSVWSGEDQDPYYPENEFFACRLDSGRTLRLGHDYCGDAYEGCDFLDVMALAGEKVAYVGGHYNGRYGPDARMTLTVFDTATWYVQRTIDEREEGAAAARQFEAAVLKPNGSVAWILYRADYTVDGYTETYEVWKADGAGRKLLDSDPNIMPWYWALTLSGSVLEWRLENGEMRSATLD